MPGLRSQPKWWRILKARGFCVHCWKKRDREGATCTRCRERNKLAQRRRRGWDGKSEWKPKRQAAAPRTTVSCYMTREEYEKVRALADRDGVRVGTLAREAILSYVADVMEGEAPPR